MIPAFIMIGSTIMPGDLARVRLECALHGGEVVERHDDDEVDDRVGDAGVVGDAGRSVGGTDLVARHRGRPKPRTESWCPW